MGQVRYFRLEDALGRLVAFNLATGGLAAAPRDALDGRLPGMAFEVEAWPDILFLTAGGEQGPGGCVLPRMFRIIRLEGQDQVNLLDLTTGLYLCSAPVPEGPISEPLTCQRSLPQTWEGFTLSPLGEEQAGAMDNPLLSHLWALCAAATQDERLELYLEIAENIKEYNILSLMLPLIEISDLEVLAQRAMRSRAFRERLSDWFPSDPYLSRGMTDLALWLEDRDGFVEREGPRRSAPESLDLITEAGFRGHFLSVGHALTALARASVAPRRRLCVLATARNEGAYLLEWLAYHRALGVEAFFLYSNDNDDGSNELLAALSEEGEIVWVDNKVAVGGSAQRKAYAHALGLLPDILDYEWCLIIDIDEFLVLPPDVAGDAPSFFQTVGAGAEAVGINWRFMGSGGQGQWRDDFVTRRFTLAAGGPDAHVKSAIRPRRFFHSTPHFPMRWRETPYVYHNAEGREHIDPGTPSTSDQRAFSQPSHGDVASVRHFFFKSAEEMLWKFSRNRGDYPKVQGGLDIDVPADLVERFELQHGAVDEVLPMPAAMGAPLAEAVMTLRRRGRIASAEARVKRRFRRRLLAMWRRREARPEDGSPTERIVALAGWRAKGVQSRLSRFLRLRLGWSRKR